MPVLVLHGSVLSERTFRPPDSWDLLMGIMGCHSISDMRSFDSASLIRFQAELSRLLRYPPGLLKTRS
ncbi:hypothetical protein CEXT_699931 [Caerostris extrusa]|uniref:Uncharacterized protein n=1 Tax=Caerostris extrusa TaxID=172846 RepID=A0AAV4UIQ3_CAEEX|nr:hypothetical protein CEXT_699931 [Caerostris extrusa]